MIMSKSLTSTSGVPIVLMSNHQGFATNAMALMTPARVRKAVSVADEHLRDHPRDENVFLEILGACDDFRACKVTGQLEGLILSRNGMVLLTLTQVQLANGRCALCTCVDALVI